MKRIPSVLTSILLVSFAVVAPAFADVAPDPCMGKAAGDMCTTPDMKAGTCQPDAVMLLTCVASSSSSSSSGSGSSSSSSSGGSEPADDGGCAFRSASSVPIGMVSGGLAIFALGSLFARRRRR